MELQGKVALVSGASSGIGAATARRLAARGVKVGLAARRTDRLEALAAEIRAAGGEALPIAMDVTDPAAVSAGVAALAQAFGAIDIAFNNAGLMPISDLESLKTDEWHRMMDVNVKGLMNTTAAVLPYMKKQGGGHIVNTSSIAGRKVFPGLSVYCASKHAVTAFSEGLRLEVAPRHNIRVTCIQPGAVESELFEHISDAKYREQMEQLKDQMTFLKAEDIADTILFALQAPAHVNVAEVFVLPTTQPW
ncbi:NADP-dependent 3-hydroxy acid dehydrogenase YdfG [Variovorax sp. TBS-050B]|uniref:SDR family oxidoreductase n=1 Tax=Variovorax sp. TBS-050B TaxID=2940551 RepID=UPI00247388D4|nr:SDR family oxidoreductase [Variovorax sp. TBS-050B]MDH6590667.1 NADP-dependent 3-hydroxy acid dehydrogenase YdfG [Variovorax sp. TBS-050B]